MGVEIVLLFAVILIAAVYMSYDREKKRKKRLEKKLVESFGKLSKRKYSEDEYELIAHYYEDCSDGEAVIDDITWNDLDMDSVYKAMNICNSSAGQEYLYRMLRCPKEDEQSLFETDRLANLFEKDKDKRINIQKIYAKLGLVRHISLSDYIGLITELKVGSNTIHYLLLLFMLASFVVCFAVSVELGIAMIIASVSASVITYYAYKSKVESYFVCIVQLVKMLNTAKEITALKYTELDGYNKRLKEIVAKFNSVTKNSTLICTSNVDGSLVEMVLDYVRLITHIDLIKYNSMVRMLHDYEKDMFELMNMLGYIEACISIASFRQALPYRCRPQFVSGQKITLAGEDMYHPLIAKPVANSISVDKHILLTGSNASGKSTFLKTVAINALLSQTIYTSVARSYKASMFRIYSSMSLRDDLGNSDSYYIVEIKSLKRILDRIADKNSMPVLCFVDEVLRGTNTVERIAASSQILKSIRYSNALCFAATHDIELTSLLEKYYDNYHFQEEVTDDDVRFNYKLFKGPATTRNAIKLLNIIGYDKEVISAAENCAAAFLKNGSW